MQDTKQIWEFGRWIARRDPGSARLSWTGGEIVLGVRQGRIHSAVGMDSSELASRLARESTGEEDLLAEARALGQMQDIPETQAMGAAKEILQEGLHRWLMDSDREFFVDEGEPPEADGATISITHALVELVLSDTKHNVAETIIPSRDVSLKRSGGFIELYAPLRLSEEADLIVASITGSASVAEIERESVHHPDEVIRLVAALVATGVLEASEPIISADDLDWPDTDLDMDHGLRQKIPVWMIGAAAAVLLIVVAVVLFVLLRGDGPESTTAVGTGDWGIVVEMGCEPQDLQRMLRKRSVDPKAFRTVMTDPTGGNNCVRLIWGSFATRVAAEEAVDEVPTSLFEEGFQPHVIEVAEDDGNPGVEG